MTWLKKCWLNILNLKKWIESVMFSWKYKDLIHWWEDFCFSFTLLFFFSYFLLFFPLFFSSFPLFFFSSFLLSRNHDLFNPSHVSRSVYCKDKECRSNRKIIFNEARHCICSGRRYIPYLYIYIYIYIQQRHRCAFIVVHTQRHTGLQIRNGV